MFPVHSLCFDTLRLYFAFNPSVLYNLNSRDPDLHKNENSVKMQNNPSYQLGVGQPTGAFTGVPVTGSGTGVELGTGLGTGLSTGQVTGLGNGLGNGLGALNSLKWSSVYGVGSNLQIGNTFPRAKGMAKQFLQNKHHMTKSQKKVRFDIFEKSSVFYPH